MEKCLTKMVLWGIINEHVWESALERYRSGHNEAVLKTVCPQGRVGSNPTLSADCTAEPERWVPGAELNNDLAKKARCESTNAEVPKWLKGLPWKGSRSLVAARGFKSLLLRFNLWRKTSSKKLKKFLTNRKRYDRINELPLRTKATTKQSSLKTEQYVKPWKFL